MVAVDWHSLGYAGTFVFGILVGIIIMIRLAKVLAELFHDLRAKYLRRDDDST